jgi:hypothetical protein
MEYKDKVLNEYKGNPFLCEKHRNLKYVTCKFCQQCSDVFSKQLDTHFNKLLRGNNEICSY